jgi:hypothetical protein
MSTGATGPQGPLGLRGVRGVPGRKGQQGTPYGPPGYSFYSPGGVASVSNVSLDTSVPPKFYVNFGNVPYGTFLTAGSDPGAGAMWANSDFPTSPPPAGAFWVLRWANNATPTTVYFNNATFDGYPSGSIVTYPAGTQSILVLEADSTYIIVYSGSGSNYILM